MLDIGTGLTGILTPSSTVSSSCSASSTDMCSFMCIQSSYNSALLLPSVNIRLNSEPLLIVDAPTFHVSSEQNISTLYTEALHTSSVV